MTLWTLFSAAMAWPGRYPPPCLYNPALCAPLLDVQPPDELLLEEPPLKRLQRPVERRQVERHLAAPTRRHVAPSRSLDVAAIQRRLHALGYDCGVIDGALGPLTRDALARFQAAKGLAPDGSPGPATLAALGLPGEEL